MSTKDLDQDRWTCRLRFSVPPDTRFKGDWKTLPFDLSEELRAELWALHAETVGEATEFALLVEGFRSYDAVTESAPVLISALKRALVGQSVGINVGDRKSLPGTITKYGREMIEKKLGLPIRAERLGLHVYRVDAKPRYLGMSATATIRRDLKPIIDGFRAGLDQAPLTAAETIAVELYSSAQFMKDADARFLLSFLAVEALAEQLSRNQTAQEHVDALIQLTRDHKGLEDSDRASMMGSLRWLKLESIRQAGLRTVSRIEGVKFDEMDAAEVYDAAYEIRNALVHPSEQLPNRADVARIGGYLSKLVQCLLELAGGGAAARTGGA